MKKQFFLYTVAILTMGVLTVQCQVFQSKAKELPANTLSFIAKYFSNDEIKRVEIDREDGVIEDYEVTLDGGTKIKFNPAGVWDEIDMTGNRRLPFGIVPIDIEMLVKNDYKGTHITEVEKKHNNTYKVKISDFRELKLNEKGEFINSDM